METLNDGEKLICSKDELLIIKLLEFYENNNNLQILLPIILQKTNISLRLLDWFVTNYCKKNNVKYNTNVNGNEILFFPYKSYKLQLKAYSKRLCDPFCRRERVIFDYQNKTITNYKNNINTEHSNYIITTIGQLNFFRFAIQYGIIKYTNEHISDIENDMNKTLKNRENEKSFMELKNIKRKELSTPGNKSVCITKISAVIKFN